MTRALHGPEMPAERIHQLLRPMVEGVAGEDDLPAAFRPLAGACKKYSFSFNAGGYLRRVR